MIETEWYVQTNFSADHSLEFLGLHLPNTAARPQQPLEWKWEMVNEL